MAASLRERKRPATLTRHLFFFTDVGRMAFLCNAQNMASTKTRDNLLHISRLPKCSYCWLETWSGDNCTDAHLEIESASDDETNSTCFFLSFFLFFFLGGG